MIHNCNTIIQCMCLGKKQGRESEMSRYPLEWMQIKPLIIHNTISHTKNLEQSLWLKEVQTTALS